jgi:Soluble lytic murein transglycosylase and related regulatory proteins (some contain LysM/invasin domains)
VANFRFPGFFFPYAFAVLLSAIASIAEARTPQQTLYLQAIDAIRSGQSAQARAIRSRLGDYPLALYIDYYDLYLTPDLTKLDAVSQFIAQDPQGLLAGRLTAKYIRLLASNGQWDSLLHFMGQEPKSLDLRCTYYYAKWATGAQQEAYQFADDLWMHNASRPGECDSLFEEWNKAGLLTAEKIWQRMLLVYPDTKTVNLLNHLDGLLAGSAYAAKADVLVQLFDNPSDLLSLLSPAQDPDSRQMAALTLKRLASTDPANARTLLQQARQQYGLQEEEVLLVEGAIARAFMVDRVADERPWIDTALMRQHDPALIELRLRMALWESDWQGVKQWVQRIPDSARSDVRWTYWLARAEEAQGRAQHAKALYRQASYERSFYGFMAADRVGAPIPLNRVPLRGVFSVSKATEQWPAVARVRELLALGERDMARGEWNYLLGQVEYNDKLELGSVALKAKWYDLAVLASINAQAWDVLELRFPTPSPSTFAYYAKSRAVETSLLYALARQESALYPYAQSPVGASGLMQLMPATAAHTARKLGFELEDSRQLTDPELNIRLGSAYLKELLDNYGGNRILAAAAYNAGPGRVRQWRRQSGGKPFDIWVENIPYRETRNYVQNVMVFNAIYKSRLQEPVRFLTDKERKTMY